MQRTLKDVSGHMDKRPKWIHQPDEALALKMDRVLSQKALHSTFSQRQVQQPWDLSIVVLCEHERTKRFNPCNHRTYLGSRQQFIVLCTPALSKQALKLLLASDFSFCDLELHGTRIGAPNWSVSRRREWSIYLLLLLALQLSKKTPRCIFAQYVRDFRHRIPTWHAAVNHRPEKLEIYNVREHLYPNQWSTSLAPKDSRPHLLPSRAARNRNISTWMRRRRQTCFYTIAGVL